MRANEPMNLNAGSTGPIALLGLPVLAYALSYIYLAMYHGKPFIFNTIVHEGGTLTLLQDMFYASHFIGHIPVLAAVGFMLAGAHIFLGGSTLGTGPLMRSVLLLLLFALVAATTALSFRVFGYEDTMGFIAQQKQGVGLYARGGSWLLHLPSTILLIAFIPAYVYGIRVLGAHRVTPRPAGLWLFGAGVAMVALFTYFFCGGIIEPVLFVWTEPRYLGHSVRELLTFPVTYFPLPLYFLLRKEDRGFGPRSVGVGVLILLLGVLFLGGLAYQSYIPLSEGIGELAQKPDFAKGGKLGIPYLLASHYFEHFLDTIFLCLFCLFVAGGRSKARHGH